MRRGSREEHGISTVRLSPVALRPEAPAVAHGALRGGLPRPAAVRAGRAAATNGAAIVKVAAGGAAPLRLPQLKRRTSALRISHVAPRPADLAVGRTAQCGAASAAGCRARRPSGGGSGRQRRGERHDCRGHRRGFPANARILETRRRAGSVDGSAAGTSASAATAVSVRLPRQTGSHAKYIGEFLGSAECFSVRQHARALSARERDGTCAPPSAGFDREALARRAAFRCRPRRVPSRRRRNVHQFPRRHSNFFSPTRFFGGSKCRVPSCALRLCGGCGGCKSGERVGRAPSAGGRSRGSSSWQRDRLAAHRCHDEMANPGSRKRVASPAPVERPAEEHAANALGAASGRGPIVVRSAERISGAWRQSKRKLRYTASKNGRRICSAAMHASTRSR